MTWSDRHSLKKRTRTTAAAPIAPEATPETWSLRGHSLKSFLQFSRALLDFHDDRQAYFVARHTPDVLKDDDINTRSRLVHGSLMSHTGFVVLSRKDLLLAANLVRVSLLSFIALRRTKKDLLASLDRVIFDGGVSEQLRGEVNHYWAGVDVESVFNLPLDESQP